MVCMVGKKAQDIGENIFVTFILFLTKNDKREERGRDQGEDAWSVKYKSIELCHPQRTKSCCKLKCFQVKL